MDEFDRIFADGNDLEFLNHLIQFTLRHEGEGPDELDEQLLVTPIYEAKLSQDRFIRSRGGIFLPRRSFPCGS